MIVSKKLRASAGHPDAHCFLNIVGVCDMQGCMLCHIRIPGDVGGAQKPDDLTASFGCGACHTALDSNGTTKGIVRGSEDWWFYATRGMVRTQRFWVKHGFITIS